MKKLIEIDEKYRSGRGLCFEIEMQYYAGDDEVNFGQRIYVCRVQNKSTNRISGRYLPLSESECGQPINLLKTYSGRARVCA